MPKKAIVFTSKDNILISVGSMLLLFSLFFSLIGYFSYFVFFHTLSFLALLVAIFFFIRYLTHELSYLSSYRFIGYILVLLLVILYFSQRVEVSHFFFSVLDASSYYLAGVSSVLQQKDIGFFLPLTSALAATGFTLFGYDYAPYIMVLYYFPSIFLVYYLFKKLGLSIILSFSMTLIFMSIPLNIWISKTSFSEPLWQLLLLLLLALISQIMDIRILTVKKYILLVSILILLPFSRGEAVLIYGVIYFLALYHFWKFTHLKSSLLILSSLLFLILSISITLQIRGPYLLKYQFSRLMPHITLESLIMLLSLVLLVMFFSIIVLYKLRRQFIKLWFAPFILIAGISFKFGMAYLLAKKNNIDISQLLFINEYSFILGTFGLLLTIAIILGMITLYIKAYRGDTIALALVTLYSIFYLPFMMQNCTFNTEHEFFLYWSRYYFSIIMLVHLFALGSLFHMAKQYINSHPKSFKYTHIVLGTSLLCLSLLSIDKSLYKKVTQESYLKNSQKIFHWLSKHVKNESLSIVYASDIKYRNYGVKQLMRQGFITTGINAKYYRQVRAKEFKHSLKLPSKPFNNTYILCLSQTECSLDYKKLKLIDTMNLLISWRKQDIGFQLSVKKDIHLKGYLFKTISK